MTKSLALFGATGSIGTSCLDLVRRQPEAYRASVLTAHQDVAGMVAIAQEFQPDLVVMSDEAAAHEVAEQLPDICVLSGQQGLIEAAHAPYDLMVGAIVGFAGLAPTYAALQQGRDVALANKEALVCAGQLMMDAAAKSGARILPVDSEHNAIFQCWEQAQRARISSVQLTASGGPFRGWRAEQLAEASLEDALKHPNWAMGPKVTLDSATLMNKALEMIEARWLFDLSPSMLEVVVHPQSVVHSCVTYADGSVLAQLGQPDMRTPIAYCLAYPDRAAVGGAPLSLTDLSALTFELPDEAAFPTLGLARAAMASDSPGACVALNAANEVLNAATRARALPFGQLMPCLVHMMNHLDWPTLSTLEDIQAYDGHVRAQTREELAAWTR